MNDTFESGRIIGSYRILRPLGSGGMGAVYEVEHLKLRTHRALKVFAVEGENAALHRKRFLSEGKMLAALDHPRVVRVHEFDVDAESGRPYFVMDLVLSPDGTPRTLEDERASGTDETRAASFFRDICEGLDYVHSLGIVHRDIKLENVLVGPDGRAVLSDFGISRIFDDELRRKLDITLTMPQDEHIVRCLGSAFYLAPELQGEMPEKATPASDAWALGVTMFRYLTSFWFERTNREKCLAVLSDYDLPWQTLIGRLCAEAPGARLGEGGFVALSDMLKSTRAAAVAKPKSRRWIWWAAALVGVAAVAAFSQLRWKGWLYDRQPSAPDVLRISVNFDDMKLLNDGEPVLIPGVAADAKSVSSSWDEAAISNLAAQCHGTIQTESLILFASRQNKDEEARGLSFDVLDWSAVNKAFNSDHASALPLLGIVTTNLTSWGFHIEPAADFAGTSNFCICAHFDYRMPESAAETQTNLPAVLACAEPLLTWSVTNDNGVVSCDARFKLQDKTEIFKRIVQYQLKQMQKDLERLKSRAACSDDKAIAIAPERQAEIAKAESAYLRRQLYEPVVKAMEAEKPETREAWKGVLTTADYMLNNFDSRNWFSIYCEFTGSGAVSAYTSGCRYPVPIAYAYASKLKKREDVQSAFSNLYVSVQSDTRWNPASRMAFYGKMAIVAYVAGKEIPMSPPSLTNACHEALAVAVYDFLKEKDYAPDEIGMAFHLVRYNGQQYGALAKAYERLKAEGVALDPWLDLMIQAQIAYCKAWGARGSGFASTVTPEGWDIYKEELDKVFPLLEKAYQLRPEQPWSCRLALDAALGDGCARELWLRRLLACRPGETAGLGSYLWGLRPRWGGSNREMAQFLLGLAKKRQFDTMVPIFAYESIVDDVFDDEGGVALEEGSFPNVDKFVLACRKHFEPYFEGYRTNNLEATLPFVQKVHLYAALADLAWRLENEKELLYWVEKLEATKIPVRETEFAKGHKQYSRYLAALRKLEGTKQHDFLVGLHALYIDGEAKAVDKMRAIAEEIGEDRLAFECALARKGKVNLIPFLRESRGRTAHAAKELNLNFRGRQRDHMLFRVKLRASENVSLTQYHLKVTHGVRERWREQYGNSIRVRGCRGEKAQKDKETTYSIGWPREQETCAFEFEIVGNMTRLTQNGVCLMERPLSAIPSLCDYFHIDGFFGVELTVQKFEMEVFDSMDFVIQSVPREDMSSSGPVTHLGPQVGGIYPEELCGVRKASPGCEALGVKTWFIINGMLELSGDDGFDKLGFQLRSFGESATAIVDCGKLKGELKGKEVVLASFALDGKPNRAMVVADTKSGEVYAVAQGNAKRWKGTGKVDFAAAHSQFAFGYDYAHGVVAYQRAEGGEWKLLVACDKCRYKGEKPTQFLFGSFDKASNEKLPFCFLLHLPVRGIYGYPKMFSAEDLKAFPRKITRDFN